MMCTCQLIIIEYSGCGNGYDTSNGKIISLFDGRLKGAGINDSLIIDFYQSIACQVVGSVHTCVYQFQYLYTGQPIPKYIGNTSGSNVNMKNNSIVNVNGNKVKNSSNSNNKNDIRNITNQNIHTHNNTQLQHNYAFNNMNTYTNKHNTNNNTSNTNINNN